MLESQFEKFGYFIERNYKIIIAIWIVIFIISTPFAIKATSIVNYNVEFTGSNQNSLSQKAQAILNTEFKNNSDPNGTAVVVFVNKSFNSTISYELWVYFNSTYKNGLKGSSYSSIVSPYEIYSRFLNSIGNSTYIFYKNVENISFKLNSSFLKIQNFSKLVNKTFENINLLDNLYKGTYFKLKNATNSLYLLISKYYEATNFSAFVIYGIPLAYENIYIKISQMEPNLSNSTKDSMARNIFLNDTHNLYNNSLGLIYFNYFYNYWNNSSGEISLRLNNSITNAYYSTSVLLNTTEYEIFQSVFENLNLQSYMSNITRNSVILNITYSLGYNYGKQNPIVYNATFQTFVNKGNLTTLTYNLTLNFLNGTSNAIEELFNESPLNFLNYIISVSINNSTVSMQILSSSIGNYLKNISASLNLSANYFINISTSSSFNILKMYYVTKVYPELNKFSNLTHMDPRLIAWEMLNNTTQNYSYITKNFVVSLLKYSPFAQLGNFSALLTDSIITKGYLTELAPYGPQSVGISINYSLYGLLIPPNFGGFTFIITFNQSSLNSTQLTIVNQYLSDLQSNFPELTIYYTGSDEIAHGLEKIANQSLIQSIIIGVIISIIIVGLYFRSIKLAFIPMGFFIFSMTITLALSYIIFGLLQHSSLSFIVTTLSAILIMGLSTDYSVYIINRYLRTSQDERVKTTVQWAGHAVFTSSIIVIISYLVMALFNIPLIGDGGYLNALGILITLLVALTLLPSFLHYSHGKSVLKHKFNFSKVASISRNHKYMFTAFLVILLVASLIIYEITPTSFDLLSLIPNNPGKIGYYQIVKSYGFDPFDNNYIILKLPYKILNNGTFNSTDLKIVQSFDRQILQSGYINKIETVDYPFGSYVDLLSLNSSYPSYHIIVNQSNSFIGKSAYYVLINIYSVSVSFSQNAVNSISKLDKLLSELSKNYGINYWIGGPSQSLLDSSNFIKASTYTIVEVLSIIIFVVLSYQLSALLTPLRLLLNVGVSTLTSVAAFYIIYNYTLHYPIIVFGPLFVIVTLFGVGLDYDIFLITRTREEVFKGKSDEDAIEEALKENAGVIIALGLIISAVFGALIFSPIRIISEIGVSITIGVLFETLISWMFLIPSLMLIMKKYNWWPSKIRGDKT